MLLAIVNDNFLKLNIPRSWFLISVPPNGDGDCHQCFVSRHIGHTCS